MHIYRSISSISTDVGGDEVDRKCYRCIGYKVDTTATLGDSFSDITLISMGKLESAYQLVSCACNLGRLCVS